MVAEHRYWFARRFPIGHPSNSMAPVTPEGVRVAWTFVALMAGGAAAAAVLVLLSPVVPWLWIAAPVVFAACAAWGGWYFISQARRRGDHEHTVDDYRAGRA